LLSFDEYDKNLATALSFALTLRIPLPDLVEEDVMSGSMRVSLEGKVGLAVSGMLGKGCQWTYLASRRMSLSEK